MQPRTIALKRQTKGKPTVKNSKRPVTGLSWSMLVLVLVAVILCPPITYAQITQEDPSTTALMRDKLASLLKAYNTTDAKAYAAALEPLLEDATKQSPTSLVLRYASLEVIAREGFDGLQPVIYRYAKSIFGNASKIDPKTISRLRASTYLAQATLNSLAAAPCAMVVRDALRGNLPGAEDLAGLSCLIADPAVQGLPLSASGVTLPAYDACASLPGNLVYRLDLPSTISSASISSIEVVNLPFPQILTWWQDWSTQRWVSISPRQFADPLPAYAQTESFTVRVTTTTGVTNFPVTFPVNRGLRVSCSPSNVIYVGIGKTVNLPVYGNGPRGARVWSASAASGSSGFPAGLALAQGTGPLAGHAVVTGTVQPNAVNGVVNFAFTQSAITTNRQYTFQVRLRTDSTQVAQLSAIQTIERGQVVSLQLPAASGGTGTYRWTIGANNVALPAGLSLTQNGNGWFVSGTVASNSALDLRPVRLALSSGTQTVLLTLTFDARRPLNVYTQNMRLFPEHLVDPEVDCLSAYAYGVIPYFACVGVLRGVANTLYSEAVHNTDADNRERADILLAHLNAQNYDVVTLQEVWDGPLSTAELEHIINNTSASYGAVQGPDNYFSVIPPDFKNNSGLLTLVKRSASSANQPSPEDHAETFTNRGGLPDSMANKGFVATKVFVTDNPNEFVWVVNTHLHAFDSQARESQLRQELLVYLNTLPRTNPVLLLGDLNIRADEDYPTSGFNSEYAVLRSILADFNDLAHRRGLITSSWYQSAYEHQFNDEEPDKRLDYILLRQGDVYVLDLENSNNNVAVVNSQPNPQYTSLCSSWSLPSPFICHYSDHFGLRANLKFRQR